MATISSNSMYGVSIQMKYKNAEDWGASDVLLAGEIGFELDTGKAKLGDGTTAWPSLGYYSDPVVTGLISALTERVGTNETSISTLAGRVTATENVNTTQQTDIDALKGITVISANPAPAANS